MKCEVEECTNETRTKSARWCRKHYTRWYRTGDPQSARYKRARICTHPECTNPAKRRGVCNEHPAPISRPDEPRGGGWGGPQRTPATSYAQAHKHIYADRGPASAYTCPCGQRANHWAYNHNDPAQITDPVTGLVFSTNTSNYTPLCQPCHQAYDQTNREDPAPVPYDSSLQRTTTPAHGELNRKHCYGLDHKQWHNLINTAYRNLPDNTTITPWDLDAILTWCIPLYNEYRRENTP